jgi:aminoglycoside phosphotransferase (APT) family kinase protein
MASSTATPSNDGSSTTATTRAEVLRAFGIAPDTRWYPLSVRPHSRHYVTVELHPRVIRVIDSTRSGATAHEATVTELLREAGYCQVPRFHRLAERRDGWSCYWAEQGEVSVYDFIPGVTVEPLDDSRFAQGVEQFRRFVEVAHDGVMRQTTLRRAFTRTDLALERAREADLPPGYDRIREFVHAHSTHEVIASCAGQQWGVAHGDLHAGNLVWLEDRLSGIIDFASAGEGPAGLDISAFVTGTCFVRAELRVGRVAAVLSALRRWLTDIPPYALVNLLALTAISFFLEVNRSVTVADIERRDLRRAEVLLLQRTALERCIHDALLP